MGVGQTLGGEQHTTLVPHWGDGSSGGYFTLHTPDDSQVFFTFQVQVLSSIDALTRGCGVYLQRVGVAVVSRDGYIVPLVVVQRSLTFAFDKVGPIPKVKHIVDVSVGKLKGIFDILHSQTTHCRALAALTLS